MGKIVETPYYYREPEFIIENLGPDNRRSVGNKRLALRWNAGFRFETQLSKDRVKGNRA
jgi:hypothetical protein